jgi:hypothetical protein
MDGYMKVFALFGQPMFLKRFHGYATVFWLILAFPSMIWWNNSVAYLVGISVYAVVVGHWSSWQSASTEVKQDQAMEEMSNSQEQ